MSEILSWIKSIAFYLILITVILNILPNNNYKKYVKVFTGMILVILVISPFSKLLNLDDKFDYFFESKQFSQELNEMRVSLVHAEEGSYDAMLSKYEDYIKDQLSSIVEQEGLYLNDVNIVFDETEDGEEMTVKSLDLIVSSQKKENASIVIEKIRIQTDEENNNMNENESVAEINIKKSIRDFYNISENNINISIQR